MKSKLGATLAACCALVLSVAAAKASTITIDWTESNYGGGGTITATYVSGYEYSITSMTGSFGGISVDTLSSPNAYRGNDNLVYISPSDSPFDTFGVSFTAINGNWNFSCAAGSCYAWADVLVDGNTGLRTDVPETFYLKVVTTLPAALPLFATGLAGLGLLGWRRKRKVQAVA